VGIASTVEDAGAEGAGRDGDEDGLLSHAARHEATTRARDGDRMGDKAAGNIAYFRLVAGAPARKSTTLPHFLPHKVPTHPT